LGDYTLADDIGLLHGSIPNTKLFMDDSILKSFILEIFLSLSILILLVLNIRFVNTLSFNFPIINKEVTAQLFFLLCCLLLVAFNLKFFGMLENPLFCNTIGTSSFKILLLLVCIPVLFLIGRAIKIQKINFYEYLLLYLLILLAMLLLISSTDLLSAYLVIEMQALCFYILASFKRNSSFSTEAGLKYFISGSFITGIFLLGASIIYGCLGTLTFNNIFCILTIRTVTDTLSSYSFILLGTLFITVSLLFKLSAAPFHFWSPDVYEGSPLASTIIFSILPKISILIFLTRWVFTISTIFSYYTSLFLVVGVFSVFFGTIFALRQKRFKRLIIYSSIAQVGFLVFPLFISSIESIVNLEYFLVLYLISSILIWGNFILFYDSLNLHKLYSSNHLETFYVSSLSGLAKVNKIQAFSFILIFFSISGIPPLAGFLAKIFIFLVLLETKQFLISSIVIILNMISVYYYIRVIKILFFESKTLVRSNLQFQMSYSNNLQEVLIHIFVFSLFSLIYLFFKPTFLYLALTLAYDISF